MACLAPSSAVLSIGILLKYKANVHAVDKVICLYPSERDSISYSMLSGLGWIDTAAFG